MEEPKLTQAQATTLIMEVVRRGGKLEVERHSLWKEIAETVGFEYKSDADVERLLTQAAALRGAAGPTWEDRERERVAATRKDYHAGTVPQPTAPPSLGPSPFASSTPKGSGGEAEAKKEVTPSVPATKAPVVELSPTDTETTSSAEVKASQTASTGGKAKGKARERNNAKSVETSGASDEANGKATDESKKSNKRKKRSQKNQQEVEPAPEGESNLYTVEKIMGKRKRRGKTEYLIKWEGYPDSANTWEKEEDVFCTDLVQAFETEMEERNKRKRKSTNAKQDDAVMEEKEKHKTSGESNQSPQTKRQKMESTKEESEDDEPKVGFDYGDEIENILGIQRTKDGFLVAYVSWLGKDDCSYVPTQLISAKSPQKLITFYEAHISFEQQGQTK